VRVLVIKVVLVVVTKGAMGHRTPFFRHVTMSDPTTAVTAKQIVSARIYVTPMSSGRIAVRQLLTELP
jgi:hypothetical protein